MRVGIFQDVHANLPALEKALEIFKKKGCEKIYHVGDLIGIGPYPKECLELCNSIDKMEYIMGNHDYWYAYGLPNPIPNWMSKDEVEHQNWTHNEIGKSYIKEVRKWKFRLDLVISHKKITFQHYGLNKEQKWFKPIIKNPDKSDIENLFEGVKSDLIFYGHQHQPDDTQIKSRYVNLGSAGCHDKSEVRIGILKEIDNNVILEKMSVKYEDNGLIEEFE